MKKFILGSIFLLTSIPGFASQCFIAFKSISLEHGCIESTSKRLLSKELDSAEDCFYEAIRLSKKQPLALKMNQFKLGGCGPDGSYPVTKYNFVDWQFGSIFDLEWPVKGKVNALTERNIDGFQDGNQVYDKEGFLIH